MISLRRQPAVCRSLQAVLLAAAALDEVAAAEKSGYSLVNPVPAALLRELSTDRPDVTESPFTVDAGHAQLEMDFANATRNRIDGARTTEWGVAAFNVRVGVSDNLEAGIFVSPYVKRSETPRGGSRETSAGIGDVTLRGKFNFWGNDGGKTAGGLIVDVTLPTAERGLGSGHVEGLAILPVAFELDGGWEGGAMTAMQLQHRESASGYHAAWINTATVGHAIAGDVSGYVELTSAAGEGGHVATFDVGMTWKLDANTQLDGGANFGITRSADDVLVFAGMSRRF